MSEFDVTPEEMVADMATRNDMMGAGVVTSIAAIDAQLEKEGWDQPPRLLCSWREIGKESVGFGWAQFGPPIVDGYGHPGDSDVIVAILGVIATALRKNPKIVHGGDVFAWALVHEAWAAPMDTAEQRDRGMKASQRYEVHKLPDRIELRIITVVDNTGIVYQLHHRRHDHRQTVIRYDPHGPITEGVSLSGRLIEPLTDLQVAMGNIPAPPSEPELPASPWTLRQMLQYLGLPVWQVNDDAVEKARDVLFETSRPQSFQVDGEERWTQESVDQWVGQRL